MEHEDKKAYRPRAEQGMGQTLTPYGEAECATERPRAAGVTEYNVHDVMSYHRPEPDQIPRFEAVSLAAENLARVILASAPNCADKSEALRCVRAAKLWANSAIALRGEI